jgi:hypothetical protein
MEKKRLQQEKRDDDARQLSIFPEEAFVDPAEREIRERRAEIRARVQERVSKRASPARAHRDAGRVVDAGEIPLGRAKAFAAARELAREPDPEPADPRTDRYAPLTEPVDFEMPLGEAGLEDAREPLLELGMASGVERVISGAIDMAFVALIQLTLFLPRRTSSRSAWALFQARRWSPWPRGRRDGRGLLPVFLEPVGPDAREALPAPRGGPPGRPLGFGRAALRLVATLVAALPLGAGSSGSGPIPTAAAGDRIAGTKVIRGWRPLYTWIVFPWALVEELRPKSSADASDNAPGPRLQASSHLAPPRPATLVVSFLREAAGAYLLEVSRPRAKASRLPV